MKWTTLVREPEQQKHSWWYVPHFIVIIVWLARWQIQGHSMHLCSVPDDRRLPGQCWVVQGQTGPSAARCDAVGQMDHSSLLGLGPSWPWGLTVVPWTHWLTVDPLASPAVGHWDPLTCARTRLSTIYLTGTLLWSYIKCHANFLCPVSIFRILCTTVIKIELIISFILLKNTKRVSVYLYFLLILCVSLE